MSDAKFMTKQYNKTRRNMSKSGAKAFKKAQTQAATAAASMFPIGRLMGGIGRAYKLYKMKGIKKFTPPSTKLKNWDVVGKWNPSKTMTFKKPPTTKRVAMDAAAWNKFHKK